MTYRQRLTLAINAFPRTVTHYPLPAHRRITHTKRLTPSGKRTWSTELV